jgi:hypothetical protein
MFHRLILSIAIKTDRDARLFNQFHQHGPLRSEQVLTSTCWSSYYLDGSTVCLWVEGTLTNRFVANARHESHIRSGSVGRPTHGSGRGQLPDGSELRQRGERIY